MELKKLPQIKKQAFKIISTLIVIWYTDLIKQQKINFPTIIQNFYAGVDFPSNFFLSQYSILKNVLKPIPKFHGENVFGAICNRTITIMKNHVVKHSYFLAIYHSKSCVRCLSSEHISLWYVDATEGTGRRIGQITFCYWQPWRTRWYSLRKGNELLITVVFV